MVVIQAVAVEGFVQPTQVFLNPIHQLQTQTQTSSTTSTILRMTASNEKQQKQKQQSHQHPPPPVPNYCSECGSSNMILKIPDNDERLRAVCNDCETIVYSNPKVVVACVVLWQQQQEAQQSESQFQCLLAKRSIEPRKGYWGIPQGFMEHGETTRQAAVREVYEETGLTVPPDILKLRAVYNVPGSVQLVYEARLPIDENDDENNPMELIATSTTESSQIGWFDMDDIPELCFPTVQWALDHCINTNNFHKNNNNMNESNNDDANRYYQYYRIQQKTKFYNPENDTWNEMEDEVPT